VVEWKECFNIVVPWEGTNTVVVYEDNLNTKVV